jgi:apolipoprotein N-acyltransferase
MEQAVGQAEMIVLPETPWPFYMNRELRELSAEQLQEVPEKERRWVTLFMREARYWHNRFLDFVQKHRVYLVTGGMSEEPHGKNADPWIDRYNSAFVYPSDGREPDRYDKIHLVLFGEYVPFRYTPWLHSFYLWLNSITPWGAGGFEYSLTVGKGFKVFPMQSAKD